MNKWIKRMWRLHLLLQFLVFHQFRKLIGKYSKPEKKVETEVTQLQKMLMIN